MKISCSVPDDHPSRERKFTSGSLKNFGYHIIEAINGREAQKLIKNDKPAIDMMITDLIMPVMNGQELAEKLKDIIPPNKVLFVSGYTFDHLTRDSALDKGINFLQKPYSIHDLLKKIKEILEK